jgi:hypothetical protein
MGGEEKSRQRAAMKKVWSTPSLVQADLLRSLLEGEGIACVIRNEHSARFQGIGYPMPSGQALGFAWPEIWVPEEQFQKATELTRAYVENHEETLEQHREGDGPCA